MFERAESLLRTDPTFGSTFVNTKITNINPLLPGVADANVFRIAEITLETTSRAVWGAMNNIPPVINYTLIYTAGANGSITGTSPQSVSYLGSGTPVTAVPDTGYSFLNWSDNSIDNPRTDINVTNNVSVTSNFIGDDMLFNTQNDETGNKILDTIYQNQNAFPILVQASATVVRSPDGEVGITSVCDAANPPQLYGTPFLVGAGVADFIETIGILFIVPAGYFYYICPYGSPSLNNCIEYGGTGTAV